MAGMVIVYYRNYDSSDTTATGERYSSNDPLPTIEACGWEPPSGCQLKEWNTNRDGSGLSFQPGDTISGGSPGYDLGKYAIWEHEVISYITTDTELISVADAIRTKGGTSAQLVYPTGFVNAIDAIPTGGGGTPKTVTITLTSPVHSGEAGAPACFVYESDDGLVYTQIGSIPGPTDSVTVTVSKNLCIVEPNSSFWSAGYGSALYDAYVINETLEKGIAFYVYGDAQLTVRGINYDD